jgi:Mg-chelatase subunit ChlD
VVAKGITEAHEPTTVTTEFTENDQRIYVVHSASLPKGAHFSATLIALNAEGIEANKEVESSCIPAGCGRNSGENPVKEGAKSVVILPAPRHGFSPGDYRLDLEVRCLYAQPCTDAKSSLPFKVIPILPPASLIDPTNPPRGLNIALAALGGKVESATSEYDTSNWAATHLNDGTPAAWTSKDDVAQDVVFSFHQGREAQISGLVIDPTTSENRTNPSDLLKRDLLKHVEIWTSTTSATEGFSKVSGARLHRQVTPQFIPLPATRAKNVKVRFLSTYGGRHLRAAEISILESLEGRSILTDFPKNLALPALGGVVVRFTSGNQPDHLIDGQVKTSGWQSDRENDLPQDLVFAFLGDQEALVDRVVINPQAGHQWNWVKEVALAVSTQTPLDGFEEVGRFTVPRTAQDHAFPVGRRARFVRIRILENYSSGVTQLGEVKVIEGSAQGYQSVLARGLAFTASVPGVFAPPPVDETGVAVEAESNNIPTEANALPMARRTKGTINPLGELDHFRLTVPGTSPTVLTLELLGRPNIRTSLALMDAGGAVRKQFDPGALNAAAAELSWLVKPGDYTVRVTEPPASIVIIWDTSGSMGQKNADKLKEAVMAYLDQVLPSERLNLIRFSDEIEVLLPGFTSDLTKLKAAAQDKFFSRGGTPLYLAIEKGMGLLQGVGGNKAIIVMTDGQDSDRRNYTKFWQLLDEKRIRLYTVGLGEELQSFVPALGTTPTRMMAHIAMATTGRFFFAQTAEELKGIYQQIAAELRTPSTYYLRPSVSPGMGTLSVTASGERLEPIAAPSQIELILDGSGSMKRTIEGRQRMDIAKDVMVQVIKGLPDNSTVALRFYGHRIREGRSGDCQDSELVFPLGRINKTAMINRVRAVKALGTTPIAYTLRQVQRDFGRAQGEKLVILVTDGKEECGGSPSAVVSELVAKGIKIRLNIVGFALAEAAVKQEMERVARITGGKFYDAQDARSLRQAIQQSLAVAYDVQDAAGARVGGGLTGESPIKVPEGIYTVTVRTSGRPVIVRSVRVRYNAFTKVALRKEGQQIGVKVSGP